MSFAGYRATSPAASQRMKLNTARGGVAERLLRSRLRSRLPDTRIQSNVRQLPGKPDIVIPSARVCVFCDGDFWHGRRWSHLSQALAARANSGYWIAKIERNRTRDRAQTRKLRAGGWRVVRVWETDVLRNPDGIVEGIVRALN